MEKSRVKIIIETEDGKRSLKSEYSVEKITNVAPKELRNRALNFIEDIETEDVNSSMEVGDDVVDFIAGCCAYNPPKEVIDLTNPDIPKIKVISIKALNDMMNKKRPNRGL